MKKIAVVILNWNGRPLLERFLPSVIEHSPEADVYVADNASTDDSLDWVREHHPAVNLLINGGNYGFARGYNEALKHVEADYFVLLNSDVEVTAGWLAPLLKTIETHPTAIACQPKLLTEARRDEFEYAGAGGGLIDRFGFPFCRGRIFHTLEKDEGQYNDTTECFWASGACLFIKASAFREVGGFDNDFFAHMEEIDLCWRLKNRGYSIHYVGAATVYHVGGATLKKGDPRKTYLNFRNNLSMLFKSLPRKGLEATLRKKMTLDGIASIKFFLEGHWASAWAVFRAHMHFYAHKRELARKRSEIDPDNPNANHTGIYRRSIVLDYYLKGKKKFSELDETAFPSGKAPDDQSA